MKYLIMLAAVLSVVFSASDSFALLNYQAVVARATSRSCMQDVPGATELQIKTCYNVSESCYLAAKRVGHQAPEARDLCRNVSSLCFSAGTTWFNENRATCKDVSDLCYQRKNETLGRDAAIATCYDVDDLCLRVELDKFRGLDESIRQCQHPSTVRAFEQIYDYITGFIRNQP